MSSKHVLIAIVALASAALAAPKLEAKSDYNTTCWLGNVGEPCYNHDNGCTPGGSMVVCSKNSTEHPNTMTFLDACTVPGMNPGRLHGSCHCLGSTGASDC